MKIDRSDWEVIGEPFDHLADLEPDRREIEIDNFALSARHRRQVLELLAQHDRAESLGLDTGAPERLGLHDSEVRGQPNSQPDWLGQRLGSWRVGEVIGHGGMSVIHRGHRADGQFEKEVAIKVLRRAHLIGDDKRLSEETRILARLEHPGIARLIDSGTSQDGHGYLVMELVRGQALDAHCRERELAMDVVVKLVIEAARALEYAHQRQVVHCDVKPANLLVRDNGHLCVVDFGIAAMLQRQPAAERHLYCSPAYTAPERFQRAPPDTSQDVYSLGAVLEKLTGKHRDRDLAAICGQATARQPEDRYGSMTLFRADLEAWQQKRPVEARRGGRAYVLGRWLQRHSVAAGLGLLLVASLTLGAATALWQAREARSEAARAIAARDFLIGIFESADPALMRGEDPPASELLRRGADRVRPAMADQPRLLAELLHVIGRTQLERGLIADAAKSLDEVLSLEAARELSSLRVSALSDRGMVAYEQGLFNDAVHLLEQSRAVALEHDLEDPRLARIEVRLADMLLIDQQADRSLALVDKVVNRLADARTGPQASIRADALRVQGAALQETGRLAEAQAVLEAALDLQKGLDDDEILLAKIENDLGIVHWYREDFETAAIVFERSLQHKRAVYGDDHPQTLSTLGNLAGVNMARGDHFGAEAAWRQSLESLGRVHEGPHPDIAYTWGMLAWSHYMRDDFTTAVDHVERGLAHRDRLSDGNLPQVNWLLPLRALILLELDRPTSLTELQRPGEECGDLAGISSLQKRFCLARRLLETDPPAECAPSALPAADAATLGTLPVRWQAVYRLLRQRCGDQSVSTVQGSVQAATPQWLGRRLEGQSAGPGRGPGTGPD